MKLFGNSNAWVERKTKDITNIFCVKINERSQGDGPFHNFLLRDWHFIFFEYFCCFFYSQIPPHEATPHLLWLKKQLVLEKFEIKYKFLFLQLILNAK